MAAAERARTSSEHSRRKARAAKARARDAVEREVGAELEELEARLEAAERLLLEKTAQEGRMVLRLSSRASRLTGVEHRGGGAGRGGLEFVDQCLARLEGRGAEGEWLARIGQGCAVAGCFAAGVAAVLTGWQEVAIPGVM